jgi:ligand-binding SRPBCC domain-containing protein
MKIYKLERTQFLPLSLDKAWEYFSDPLNLPEITPPELSLLIKSRFDGEIYNGMIIEYTVQPLFGIKMDWVSEIKHVERPYVFVDEQRAGPYQFWYHKHLFKPLGKDKVQATDLVYYALPLGPLGNVLNDCIVRKKLDGIFNYRKKVLEQKFNKGLQRHA